MRVSLVIQTRTTKCDLCGCNMPKGHAAYEAGDDTRDYRYCGANCVRQAESQREPFELKRESTRGFKRAEFDNSDRNHQRALFIGKHDLAGQEYLFNA